MIRVLEFQSSQIQIFLWSQSPRPSPPCPPPTPCPATWPSTRGLTAAHVSCLCLLLLLSLSWWAQPGWPLQCGTGGPGIYCRNAEIEWLLELWVVPLPTQVRMQSKASRSWKWGWLKSDHSMWKCLECNLKILSFLLKFNNTWNWFQMLNCTVVGLL